ncbi:hypothetical protein DQ384_09870 [Sphaerisporangium album]|uniref:Uncharacterized protein n=1 Tax=Sphaerisporangium album TaxID=509200 RepID=A0A367FQE2_9ACTN|nr:hypothetical protein [Sphaerisporangium album]RCG31825.1 hypothetical protein DQ384_09870 [Sphaerisporangium album]
MSWQDLTKSWQDTSVDYCDVCGNLLIHTYWEFADGDATLRACRQEDEALWHRLKGFRAGYPPPGHTPPPGLVAAARE